MQTKQVEVSLKEAVAHDLEGFLDLLEELFLADFEEEERYNYALSNITYDIVGFNPVSKLLIIEVMANVENF